MKTLAPEKNGLSMEEQALINKAILDANDTEKKHKDVLLKNVKELEEHIKFLNARLVELDNEYRSRRKLVDGINGSIAGAQAELSQVRANFTKNNEDLIKEFNKKKAEVDEADVTLRKLMAENEALNLSNKLKESKLDEEKRNIEAQLYEMRKALHDNQSEWNKREQDILVREDALKEERSKFELERDTLTPELNRISAIKNENILLIQQVESERKTNRNIQVGIESERQFFEEQKAIEANKARTQAEKFANEEKRLREWEQNLKDFDLETRAKAAKADKMIRQYQLQKEVSG